MQRRNVTGWLVLLCAVVFAARAATSAAVALREPDAMLLPDSPSYLHSARALLAHGGFSVSPQSPGVPEIVRTPGYPLFLAASESLVGPVPFRDILLQILASILALPLVYASARSLWRSREAGLAAAALVALDPATFHHTQLILSETIFTLIFLCAVWSACRVARSPRPLRWAAAFGAALGAAALTRPIAEPLIFPAVAFLLGLASRRRITRVPLLAAAILPWLLLDGGWRARNMAVAGEPRLSAISSVNLYLYRAAGALAQTESIPFEEASDRLAARAASVPAAERYAWYRREGWAILREHPFAAIKSSARGAAKLLLGPGAIGLDAYLEGPLQRPGPIGDLIRLSPSAYARKWLALRPLVCTLLLGEFLLYAILYGGAAATFVRSRRAVRRRWPIHAFLLGSLLISIAAAAGPEAYARFRVPLIPLFAIYAARALLVKAKKAHRCVSPSGVAS